MLRCVKIAFIFILGLVSVMCEYFPAFAAGSAGYLYNVGSHMFLSWARAPHDKYMWIKGTKSDKIASLFKIQRTKYHSATYSLIMSADPRVLNAKKKTTTTHVDFPFYGTPTIGLIGNRGHMHIGMTTDTADSNAWVSFSPPITRENFFKIYLKNKCLAIGDTGYAILEDCVSGPDERHARQLFRWLADNENIIVTRKVIRRISIGPIKKQMLSVKGYNPDTRMYYNPDAHPSRKDPYLLNHPDPILNKDVPTAVVAINNDSIVSINGKPLGYYDEPELPKKTTEKAKKLLNADENSSTPKNINTNNPDGEYLPPGF
ncbi:hypothetical protein NEIG_00930 [Nematocida sp. ERTm5]|nr:hypothetical protein NEIG_00930 [Nematocida sp. ERTm5]